MASRHFSQDCKIQRTEMRTVQQFEWIQGWKLQSDLFFGGVGKVSFFGSRRNLEFLVLIKVGFFCLGNNFKEYFAIGPVTKKRMNP